MIAAVWARLRGRGAGQVVGLTGGVFQNALLTRLAVAALERAGCDVLLHERVPCNDGGLALGQAVLGRGLVRALRH
jgi:hydrogenase maturation protein HypF